MDENLARENGSRHDQGERRCPGCRLELHYTPRAAWSAALVDKSAALDPLEKRPGNNIRFHGYLRSGFGVGDDGKPQEAFKAPNTLAKYRLGNETEANVETTLGGKVQLALDFGIFAGDTLVFPEGSLFVESSSGWAGAVTRERPFAAGRYKPTRRTGRAPPSTSGLHNADPGGRAFRPGETVDYSDVWQWRLVEDLMLDKAGPFTLLLGAVWQKAENGAAVDNRLSRVLADDFVAWLAVGAEGVPRGNLGQARAHWLGADTIAWNLAGVQADWMVRLHYAPDGGLTLGNDGVRGGTAIPLTLDPAGLPADLRAAFPHLASYPAFRVPAERLADVPQALRSQLAVSALDGTGNPVDATSLQIPGVLDDLYAYDGPLGVTFEGDVPTLRVWAPTARSVKLHLFPDSSAGAAATVHPMALDPASGVWAIQGETSWRDRFYLYEIEVWVRATARVERNLVTDPDSVSLSRNSRRSQIVDLADPAWKPAGWDALVKPPLASWRSARACRSTTPVWISCARSR